MLTYLWMSRPQRISEDWQSLIKQFTRLIVDLNVDTQINQYNPHSNSGRHVSMCLSFTKSFDGATLTSLFQTLLKDVCVAICIEDRDSVSLQGREQVCFLSRIMKIMLLSGANISSTFIRLFKHWVLSWDPDLLSGYHPSGPLCIIPMGLVRVGKRNLLGSSLCRIQGVPSG